MPVTSELWGKHVQMRSRPDPVNGITRGDARVSKRRVCLRPRVGVIPPKAALCVNVLELGQSTDIGAPAKIIDDEALHARGLGSIYQGYLVYDAGRTHDTNDGILPR